MGRRRFMVWLSTLVIPLALAASIAHWHDSARPPSIGGGGYDLTGLFVTLGALGFIASWTLLALIIACFRKDGASQRDGFALALIGSLFFGATIMLYGKNLS